MRPMLLALVALLAGCPSGAPSGPVQDTVLLTDTGDPDTVPVPQVQPQARQGACTQGQQMQLDLGTSSPFALQVEVLYGDTAWPR